MQVSSVRRPRLLFIVAGASLALLQACSSSGHANANSSQTTNASTASASSGGNPSSAPASSPSGGGSAAPTGAPLKIAIVAEMSGAGAATGQQWDDGVRWAIKQVDAGGVLGHPFEALTTLDTQTVPSVSIAAMKKALQDDPYAIMGTIYSSSTQVNAPEVGAAGVPQFAGSQSDSLMNVSPTLFLAEPTNNTEFSAFLQFLKSDYTGKSVVIAHVNDAAGAPLDKTFKLPKANIKIAKDVTVDVGATDLSAVVHAVQAANPAAVIVDMHEVETAHLMVQLKAAGINIPVLGQLAVSESTISLAKSAAEGAEGTTSYTTAAPAMGAVTSAFAQANPSKPAPDANFLKGYVSVWAVAYATEAVGKADKAAVVQYLHNRAMCASKYPNLLGDEYWGSDGGAQRADFLIKYEGGKLTVVKTLAPPQQLASCGS